MSFIDRRTKIESSFIFEQVIYTLKKGVRGVVLSSQSGVAIRRDC